MSFTRVLKSIPRKGTSLLIDYFRDVEKKDQRRRNRELLAGMKSCGKGAGLWGRARITGLNALELGDNVHIGDNAFIRAEGGVKIGANTHISRNFVLYSINHRYDGKHLPYDEQMIERPVSIGKNVWIGMNVCITPGTTIGDGAIIGMGTIVSGNVPALAIVGSQKWRVLGSRSVEHYDQLERAGMYGGPNGKLLQNL